MQQNYSAEEVEIIRQMVEQNLSDAEIVEQIQISLGITRKIKALSRARARMKILKPNSSVSQPRRAKAYEVREIRFVQEHYRIMTDEEIADHLTRDGITRSAMAVAKIRRMNNWQRETEPPTQNPAELKPWSQYHKSYINPSMSEFDKMYIDYMKNIHGTYRHPTSR